MTQTSPADKPALRRALGAFATGVTIVTAVGPEGPVGFTANSFTSVSLDPPLLLVCLAHTAASYAVFCEAQGFAINVLAAGQEETAMRFATRGADKFGPTPWHAATATGSPLLEGCLAQFDCAIHHRAAFGDHDVLFGRVLGFTRHEGRALVYAQGSFSSL